MKVVIAGGTGFLGRPLTEALAAAGHTPVLLSRSFTDRPTSVRTVKWTPDGTVSDWADEIDGAAAVINLAGESLDTGRWTAARKRRILDSRVQATRSLVQALKQAASPPSVFVSASGVNYYGTADDRIATEETPPGDDFLAKVCVRWEAEAMQAHSATTRVVCLRTGLALARDGGALPRMLPPFWFGIGGPVASGRQHWAWIHRQDWIDLVRFVIDTPAISGPLNATAPQIVTNREFATALGRALHRPSFMPVPALVLKLLFGEKAQSLLLSGQQVVPAKAERFGFAFAYPTLEQALAAILK